MPNRFSLCCLTSPVVERTRAAQEVRPTAASFGSSSSSITSRRSTLSRTAPTYVFATLPSRSINSVVGSPSIPAVICDKASGNAIGYITPNCLENVSTLPSRCPPSSDTPTTANPLGPRSRSTRTMPGVSRRQGSHHVAQRLMAMTSPRCCSIFHVPPPISVSERSAIE